MCINSYIIFFVFFSNDFHIFSYEKLFTAPYSAKVGVKRYFVTSFVCILLYIMLFLQTTDDLVVVVVVIVVVVKLLLDR